MAQSYYAYKSMAQITIIPNYSDYLDKLRVLIFSNGPHKVQIFF